MGRADLEAASSGRGDPAVGQSRLRPVSVGAAWSRPAAGDRAADRDAAGSEDTADGGAAEDEFATPGRDRGCSAVGRRHALAGTDQRRQRQNGEGRYPGRRDARGAGTYPRPGRHGPEQRAAIPSHPGTPTSFRPGAACHARRRSVDPPRRPSPDARSRPDGLNAPPRRLCFPALCPLGSEPIKGILVRGVHTVEGCGSASNRPSPAAPVPSFLVQHRFEQADDARDLLVRHFVDELLCSDP